MGQALKVFEPQCDMCGETTDVQFGVADNAERFCGLTCASLFYRRPTKWIALHRKVHR